MENPHYYSMSTKIIQGIDPLAWGKSGETSFIASLTNIMKALGKSTSYIELMFMSGAAFRMQMSEDWCLSSGDWYDRSRTLHHLGYSTTNYPINHPDIDKSDDTMISMEEAKKKIRDSINHGLPVIGIDLLGIPEWGIITGYESDTFYVRDYFNPDENYSEMKKFPWIIHLIHERAVEMSRKEYFINALREAVKQYNVPKTDDVWNGREAYKFWAEDVAKVDPEEEGYGNKWQLNAWLYDLWMDGRHAIYKYLEEWYNQFDGEALVVLKRIQEQYYQIACDIDYHWIHFPFPHWVDKDKNRTFIPPYYGSGSKEPYEPRWLPYTEWTEEMRIEGSKVIKMISDKEEIAIQLIEHFISIVQ